MTFAPPGAPPHARAGSGYPSPPARNTRAGAGASTAPAQLDPGPWAPAPKWPQNILARAPGPVGNPAPQNRNQGPVSGGPARDSHRARGAAVPPAPAHPPARPSDPAARSNTPAAISGRGSLSSNLSDLTNDSHAFRPGTFFYEPHHHHHLPPPGFGRPPPVVVAPGAGAFPAMPPPPSVAPPREFAGARSPGDGAARAGTATGSGPFDRDSPPRGFYVELADSPSDSPADAAVPGSGAAGTTTGTTTAETTTISPSTAAALEGSRRGFSGAGAVVFASSSASPARAPSDLAEETRRALTDDVFRRVQAMMLRQQSEFESQLMELHRVSALHRLATRGASPPERGEGSRGGADADATAGSGLARVPTRSSPDSGADANDKGAPVPAAGSGQGSGEGSGGEGSGGGSGGSAWFNLQNRH